MFKRITLFLATGGGIGLLPGPRGTWGALPGIPLAWFLAVYGTGTQIVVCLAMVIVAVPVCSAAERIYRRTDDGRIVLDELITLPLCVIGLPLREHIWLLVPAFVVHRIFDILKPPPADQAQSLQGGLGIVVDDVVSSLYALAVNWLFFSTLRHFDLIQSVTSQLP